MIMKMSDEIEGIKERLRNLEAGQRNLERKTIVTLFKDKGEFDGDGDRIMGHRMGWKQVDVNDLVKLIFDHSNIKYVSESTVPASVVKKSK